jgi:hypothetical protein
MSWTREQAIEHGKQNASKGGLTRAARLSAARRWDIAMLANSARWRNASSELGWIDRELDKLEVLAAYAMKNGDFNLCLRAIQIKMDGIKHRLRARQRLEDEQRRVKDERRAGDRETVCAVDGCTCGGELEEHWPQCVVRNCRCVRPGLGGRFGRWDSTHYLLRRTGPHSRYVCDISDLQRTCGECGKEFLAERPADTEKSCAECRGKAEKPNRGASR